MRVNLSGNLSGGGVMLMLRPTCPVDYSICDRTVTVYHYNDADKTYTTSIIRNAYFEHKLQKRTDKLGGKETDTFLLIVPGSAVGVSVGDKVLVGEGEEITTREAWAALNPAIVPDLAVVKWVDPKYWRGAVVHTEAGG